MNQDNSEIPRKESDVCEFKSSLTTIDEYGKKLCKAGSAFSNSGGGTLYYGVGDDGRADGGVSDKVNSTSLSDWIDQKLALIQPAVQYSISKVKKPCGNTNDGKFVIAVNFKKSELAPHMAPDNKYYIRAGAHTVPASAFIVEALWNMRKQVKPLLATRLRYKPADDTVVQLEIVSLSSAPAVDVEVTFSPLPPFYNSKASYFPLVIPYIEQESPFTIDLCWTDSVERDVLSEFDVIVKYKSLGGSQFEQTDRLVTKRSLPGSSVPDPFKTNLILALGEITKAIEKLKSDADA